MENPSTKRFREEFKSINCRLESPTAVIIPEKKTSASKFQSLTRRSLHYSTGDRGLTAAEGRLPTMSFLCPIRNRSEDQARAGRGRDELDARPVQRRKHHSVLRL